MWFRQNKWKILTPVIILVILAAAFWYGGNAPGSHGWQVGEETTTLAPEMTTEGTMDGSAEDPAEKTTEEVSTERVTEATTRDEVTTGDAIGEQTTTEAAEEVTTEKVTEQETATEEVATQDRYLTDPVPEGKPKPVEPQDVVIGTESYTCTISINCENILNNLDYCDPDKVELVPADGWILKPLTVTFYEGESVFNVLRRTCKQQGIHMEFEDTPIYNSAYIEGIANLYEFDVGELSGWMYSVNGWFPNYGASRYQLSDGDVIEWRYTCDLGKDVGNSFAESSRQQE